MTWNASSEGPRVLTQHETILFCYAIVILVRFKEGSTDVFEQDLPILFINSKFSDLSDQAMFAILEKTCRELMEDTGNAIPELTWYNESVIYYVYWFFGDHALYPLLNYLKKYQFVETNQRRAEKLKVIADHAKDLVKLLQDVADGDSEEDSDENSDEDEESVQPNKVRKTGPVEKDIYNFELQDIHSMIEKSVDKILWDRDFEELMMNLYGKGQDLPYYANYREDPRFPHEEAGDRLFDYALAALRKFNFFEGEDLFISSSNFEIVYDIMYNTFYIGDEDMEEFSDAEEEWE